MHCDIYRQSTSIVSQRHKTIPYLNAGITPLFFCYIFLTVIKEQTSLPMHKKKKKKCTDKDNNRNYF